MLSITSLLKLIITESYIFSPPPDIEMSEKRKSRRDMSPQGRKGMVMSFRDPITDTHRKVCAMLIQILFIH